jgi:hypothetical protein
MEEGSKESRNYARERNEKDNEMDQGKKGDVKWGERELRSK